MDLIFRGDADDPIAHGGSCCPNRTAQIEQHGPGAKREGKLERAIREHLTAHPDEAFTTDDLCCACYGIGWLAVERKHRVAVLRAFDKVSPTLPDGTWGSADGGRGGMRVFCNGTSVRGTARQQKLRGYADRDPRGWDRFYGWDDPENIAEAERGVAYFLTMRDGTPEQRTEAQAKQEAEYQAAVARAMAQAAALGRPTVLSEKSKTFRATLGLLAGQARALLTENDPDAVRAGLTDIAAALDALAVEVRC
jgi:hypothetical protein